MKEITDIKKIYIHAAEAIKQAILHSQYEAAKGVNRLQLATYYWIGKIPISYMEEAGNLLSDKGWTFVQA